MSEDYKPLSNRWFNLATDVCRTYIKGLVMVEERTLDITRAMLHQVDAVQEQVPHLLEEVTSEVRRTRSLVQETVERTRTISTGNRPSVRRLSSRYREVNELPAPNEPLDKTDNEQD